MTISSRTPEGQPNRCPVCRHRLRISPSWPTADAPCPRCGALVWFPAVDGGRTRNHGSPSAFTLDTFRAQLPQALKMSMQDWLGELPNVNVGISVEETEAGIERMRSCFDCADTLSSLLTKTAIKRLQGMIDAMTKAERADPGIIDAPRRRRIAAGAGVSPHEVGKFLKDFAQVRSLMMQMSR